MDKLIRDADFCIINTNKFEKEGAMKGQRVYIAGHRAFPESEEDPYTQRIKFFVHLIVNKTIDERLFVMDPRSLTKVGKREQNNLTKWLTALVEENPPSASVN